MKKRNDYKDYFRPLLKIKLDIAKFENIKPFRLDGKDLYNEGRWLHPLYR
jgi:hypothetical protein